MVLSARAHGGTSPSKLQRVDVADKHSGLDTVMTWAVAEGDTVTQAPWRKTAHSSCRDKPNSKAAATSEGERARCDGPNHVSATRHGNLPVVPAHGHGGIVINVVADIKNTDYNTMCGLHDRAYCWLNFEQK